MTNITRHKPYLIAEAGVAHFGSLEKAIKMLEAAVEAKCDAFKLQHYNVNSLFANDASGWKKRLKGRTLKKEELKVVRDLCEENKIDFMLTLHDNHDLELINKLDLNTLKIGSGEAGNLIFIRECMEYAEKIIYSTGLSCEEDIDNVIKLGEECETEVAILHCNTSYPTPENDVNLRRIGYLLKKYENTEIGYSDHTVNHIACIGAVIMGATIIERHITLEKDIPNAQDWKVSSTPEELIKLRQSIDSAMIMRGTENISISESASQNIEWAKKSPYAKNKLEKGSVIREDDIVMKRPFTGHSYNDILNIIGKTTSKSIEKDDLIDPKTFS